MRGVRAARVLAILVITGTATGALGGCYRVRPSSGGGQTSARGTRTIRPADVALPPGYSIEAVATELTFPTSVIFDDRGTPVVVEAGYSYGESFTTPRLLRVETGEKTTQSRPAAAMGRGTGAVSQTARFSSPKAERWKAAASCG